ncbi:MAG: ATPase domain-containing protein [Bacillota bacterium]|nr:ATPase domain-containing protein [Bacillota bacterium]
MADQTHTDMPRYRQPTGIPGLDEMMGGGIPEGSTTMVVGPTGSGKRLITLHWLIQGARAGQPGVLLSYDSPPQSILRHTSQFGWDLAGLIEQGLLRIAHISPIEVGLEGDLERLSGLVVQHQVRRTVVDSISSLEIGMRDRTAYTDYLWGLTDWFKLNCAGDRTTSPGVRW